MKHILILIFSAIIIAGCSPSKSQIAAGEFNLSKGKCVDIPLCDESGEKCRTITEKMTYNNCQMLKGKFEPRNHKRLYWF